MHGLRVYEYSNNNVKLNQSQSDYMLHFLSKMPFYAAYRWVNSGQVGEIVSLKTHGNTIISHTYLKLNTSENVNKANYLGLRFIMLSMQDARD